MEMIPILETPNESIRRRNDNHLESFSLIWLNNHENVDIQTELRNIINHIEIFHDVEECKNYIEKTSENDRLVLVTNDEFGRQIIPSIHQLRQSASIYINSEDKQWTNDFSKVKGIHAKMDELVSQIHEDHKNLRKMEEPVWMNMFTTISDAGKSTTGINGQFAFSQLLLDCLLRLKSNENDRNELISYCQKEYEGNQNELNHELSQNDPLLLTVYKDLAKIASHEKDYEEHLRLRHILAEIKEKIQLNDNEIETSEIDKLTYNDRIQKRKSKNYIRCNWQLKLLICSFIVILMIGTGIFTLPYIITKSSKGLKPKFNRWNQNAITVAGGNEVGQELNQLSGPYGIFIDKNKNIFITDHDNHRIVEWKYNATEGQIIAGGNDEGDKMDQLNLPTDVIVDQQNHSIIIADSLNGRVIQWLNQTQQILIQNIFCWSLAMDKNGFLYVSDIAKNEVRRWKMGQFNNEGIIVAGGNGKGDQLNQLNSPTFIFVDEDQSLYVSDKDNSRVMKWIKGAKEGSIVAGGNGQGKNINQLYQPQGVIVDDLGQVYVADFENHRVMRWREGKEEGEIVVGESSRENQSKQLSGPTGLSFDDDGNLYVADYWNHRIQKFEIIL
ncbi:unnamed protein product [Adineta steineri]|uniref:Uncharacterized protein n=1 Tax=Adineta steineri TaxID=433720 RepID=A0A813RH55_9BILA|nr:unnamed protein product [Adineta steineri]CAF1043344.1 unnamed protein product [Adineta steineri]